ncbi:MAG: hypothetical protein JXQ87_00230 [Bacteroidia bacterium]
MNKSFNLNSEKIEAHFLSKPEHWQGILFNVRDFILHSHKQMQEFYKYKTPFFGIEKNICYMNLRADQSALDIGFVQGRSLEETHPVISPFLEGKNLKSIRHVKIKIDEWPEKMDNLNQVLILAIDYCLIS